VQAVVGPARMSLISIFSAFSYLTR
jgi:hypothetical protein